MIRSTLLVLFAAAAIGCSGNPVPPRGVTVTGKILKEASALKAEQLPPGEFIAEVVFVPLDPDGVRESERVNPNGTFKEIGWERGIKPGKYRLAVTHFVRGRGSDGLNGAFSDQNSPIIVEIPPDKVGGTFDLKTIELNDYNSK